MTLIDDIKRGREAGDDSLSGRARRGMMRSANGRFLELEMANHIDRMEAALLAAEELARAVEDVGIVLPESSAAEDLIKALDAFRKALEAGE